MAALYASEINCSLSTLWDQGWTVRLGDEMNGFAAEAAIRPEELDRAAAWLAARACEHYPDSDCEAPDDTEAALIEPEVLPAN